VLLSSIGGAEAYKIFSSPQQLMFVLVLGPMHVV
jgi:hypothetical protein